MPEEAPSHVTQRDLWDAIERLRKETSEARHAQGNLTTKAIAELRLDMDNRLRILENLMASSNPASMGPRLNDLERWQSRSDGDDSQGLPHRVGDLEQWRDQMSGVLRAIGIIATASGVVSTALVVLQLLKVLK